MRIITIASQKGGVGKTTTIVNLGSWLALLGHKVLILDLDPQSSASSCLGFVRDKVTHGGIQEALLENRELDKAVYKTVIKNLFLVPSNVWYTETEQAIVDKAARNPYVLRDTIDLMEKSYDFVLIDSPPAIVSIPMMALTAADAVLVPLQCEYLALSTLPRLLNLIVEVREKTNQWLQLEGIFITMYEAGTRYARQIVNEAKKQFDALMFDTLIPRHSRLSEATTVHRPVVLYDIHSIGSKAYLNFAQELLTRYQSGPSRS